MGDSWEDQADEIEESEKKATSFSFNPKASSFSFNPSASSFAPPGGQTGEAAAPSGATGTEDGGATATASDPVGASPHAKPLCVSRGCCC